jgi:uncharacterized membrane protein
MAVDVETSIEIRRPRQAVAEFAADPTNTTRWYANIRSVEWRNEPPLRAGSQLAFVAQFLGRRLKYSYEVQTYEPGERLVMRTAQGAFPMETTYRWEDLPGGATLMRLRNRGEPAGFSRIAAPAMARAMRRATQKDLERLRAILEADG